MYDCSLLTRFFFGQQSFAGHQTYRGVQKVHLDCYAIYIPARGNSLQNTIWGFGARIFTCLESVIVKLTSTINE